MAEQISQEVLLDYQSRTVVTVSNLYWNNAEHTALTGDVLFAELEAMGPVPFTAVPNGDTAHGQEIWDKAAAGEYGPIAEYVEPPVDLAAYAANKRWQVETGGITINGETIRTDQQSQSRITGAYTLTLADPTLTTIDWEATPGNWVTVDAATMKAIGIAVGRHVQACFSTLRTVQADIDAGTITTTAEIDAAFAAF